MGRACNTHGRGKKYMTQNLSELSALFLRTGIQ
jgi:hypothetical protein